MASYASISIDRRADYYARCAEFIAADPLDFYTRAEKGRRFQASRLNIRSRQPSQVVAQCLSNVGIKNALPLQHHPLMRLREPAFL